MRRGRRRALDHRGGSARDESLTTALNVTKPGSAVGIVGVPPSGNIPNAAVKFTKNISGGIASTQANIADLLLDVLDGTIQPGKVFDRTVGLDETPEG